MSVDGRRRRLSWVAMVTGLALWLGGPPAQRAAADETPSATPADTPTATPSVTDTGTPSQTPTPSFTPTVTPTFTVTATWTPTRTPIPTRTTTQTRTATAPSPCGNGKLDGDEACDDGNRFGGDNCAANCTLETPRIFTIDPHRSDFRLQTRLAVFDADTDLGATVPMITGAMGPDGRIPIAVPLEGLDIEPVQTLGACTCFKPVELPQRFGPGNAGAGWIDCAGAAPASYELVQDHEIGDTDPTCSATVEDTLDAACKEDAADPPACNPESPHDGGCNGPLEAVAAGGAAPGAAVIWLNLSVWTVYSPGAEGCALHPGQPAYGPDDKPCTADDPGKRPPRLVPIATGKVSTRILDATELPGTTIGVEQACGLRQCEVTATGAVLDCAALASDPGGGLDRIALGLSVPVIDGVNQQDVAISYWLNSTQGPTVTPPPTRTASATFTPTPVVSPSATRTHTASRTPTRTRTPTITSKPPPTRTPTRTRTPTITPRPSGTPTGAFTHTPTRTQTAASTRTLTYTPTAAPTRTATPEDTETATRTPTHEHTHTATHTARPEPTYTPPPKPPTVTTTATHPAPTATWTNSAKHTATMTPVPSEPSATPSQTPAGSIPGDVNGDGAVSAVDLDVLVAELFDGDGDAAVNAGGGLVAAAPGADANGDGRITAADGAGVVAAL